VTPRPSRLPIRDDETDELHRLPPCGVGPYGFPERPSWPGTKVEEGWPYTLKGLMEAKKPKVKAKAKVKVKTK
jgi:hypothetical protein